MSFLLFVSKQIHPQCKYQTRQRNIQNGFRITIFLFFLFVCIFYIPFCFLALLFMETHFQDYQL